MTFFAPTEIESPIAVTDELVTRAEATLGFRLPETYVDLLRERNGGRPKRRCFHTGWPTSWGRGHFEIDCVLGVGHENGIDGRLGSAYLIGEWGYPRVGIVIVDTPSGGHDTVMLDYSSCGPRGEPRIVYVDEDRRSRVVASSFAEFISKLVDCKALPQEA